MKNNFKMDSSYERLSIRESVRSLKKYGSTSKHVNVNQNFIKHVVTKSDTLQGLALKYGVTMEDIRRANRLYTSDSLFLREHLLIPVPDDSPLVHESNNHIETSHSLEDASSINSFLQPPSTSSPTSPHSDDDISNFLLKIDSSIASTKAEVRKTYGSSEFTNIGSENERRRPITSRMRRTVNNNNSSMDSFDLPKTVVTSGGKKLQRSLQRLEQEQDEFFEL